MASFGNVFVMPGLVLAAIIVMSSARLSSASGDIYGNYADRDASSSSPSPSTTEDDSSSSSYDDNYHYNINAYPPITYPSLPNYKDGPPSANFPDELPPEPSQIYYRHLRECADKISPLCAEQIFAGMFYSNEELTEDCCTNLLHMGYDCHRGLVKLILLETTFKGKASEALQNSFQIWNKCVKIVDQADSPSPAAAAAF